MSAAEPMDPQAFKPDVQIEPSEVVPWSKIRGRIDYRCSTGDRQESGSMTGNDEFILETIAGPLNRETTDVFSLSITTCEQESRSRMRTDRGEVEVEEARQQRVRRASKERNEYEVIRTVLRNWCDSCVKRRANTPIDVQQVNC